MRNRVKAQHEQQGAAIVESVMLIMAVAIFAISGLNGFSLAIKQTFCEKVFIEQGDFKFLPEDQYSTEWVSEGSVHGCFTAFSPTPWF